MRCKVRAQLEEDRRLLTLSKLKRKRVSRIDGDDGERVSEKCPFRIGELSARTDQCVLRPRAGWKVYAVRNDAVLELRVITN